MSWSIGPESIIEKVCSAGSFIDGGAAHSIQEAAIPLLDPYYANQEAMLIQENFAAKRDLLKSGLESLGFMIPGECSGVFYCFASVENLYGVDDGMILFE